LVGLPGYCYSQPVAKLLGNRAENSFVPSTDEDRGHRRHRRVESLVDASLDAPHERLCGGEVLLGGEQQRRVDRDALEDALLDRCGASPGPRDLDEQVIDVGHGVQGVYLADRPGRVVHEEWGDL